jgi:hypothetical protein
LDSARFVELLLAQLLDGKKIGWLSQNRHGFVRRGEYTERGVPQHQA